MAKEQLNKSKILTLAACFGISILLWFASNFSHQYEKEIPIYLSYTDIPDDKLIAQPVNVIYTTIRTTGWSLLFTNYEDINIKLKWEDFDERGLLSVPNTENFVQHYISKSKIINTQPENFVIQATDLANKKVPLELHFDTDGLPENFFLSSAPQLSHDSISIYGTKEQLANINAVKTEKTTLNDSEIEEQKLIIQTIENVRYEREDITIQYKIEEFSEKEIEVNVSIANAPENIEFSIFPEQIKLKSLLPF
ncbi:MAG: hypothetical protein ACPG4Z_05500, partial [Chitinophagales bacterium]